MAEKSLFSGRNGSFPKDGQIEEIQILMGQPEISPQKIADRIREIMAEAGIPKCYFMCVMIEDGKLIICATNRGSIEVDSNLKAWRSYTGSRPVRFMPGRNVTGHYLPASSHR